MTARADQSRPTVPDGADSADPGRLCRQCPTVPTMTVRAGSCREKEHPAKPMSVDDALFEMETGRPRLPTSSADADTGRPTVVYRRHAYDYGVIPG